MVDERETIGRLLRRAKQGLFGKAGHPQPERAPGSVINNSQPLVTTEAATAVSESGRAGSALSSRRETAASLVNDWPVKTVMQAGLSGFSGFAVTALDNVLGSDLSRGNAFQTAFALARVHSHRGDQERAATCLEQARKSHPGKASRLSFRMLEADVLARRGRLAGAREIASLLLDAEPDNSDIKALYCGLIASDSDRLEELNRWLASAGFAPMNLRDTALPLTIDNLGSATLADEVGPTVSVIMPVFNASATLEMAARGVLEQSWRKLELIIIDDASTDASWSIVSRIAKADNRVVPIRLGQNGGAYRARNTGLSVAKGDFVTVNDADDWCHPQKIAAQMREMLDHAAAGFNITCALNTDLRLVPIRNPRSGRYLLPSRPSLLIATDVLRRLGGCFDVRIGADAELYLRLEQYLGKGERIVEAKVPLSFMLQRPESLTNSSATSIDSRRYGLRRECREASAYWRSITSDLRIEPGERPFPVPRIALEKLGERIELDLLLVSDFSVDSETNRLCIERQLAAGRRVGLFHLPRIEHFDLDVHPSVRTLIHHRRLPMIVGGESVCCADMIVLDPAGLVSLPDLLPAVDAERGHILDQGPGQIDPAIIKAYGHAFGKTVVVVSDITAFG